MEAGPRQLPHRVAACAARAGSTIGLATVVFTGSPRSQVSSTLVLIAAIICSSFAGAWPSIKNFGLCFVWTRSWDPVHNQFGALQFIIGTLITSFGALLIAAPLSIAIGLFLSELAPPSIRGPIGTLVDMLAAVPSVVIGLWGILVLGPLVHAHIEPFLHDVLGLIPIFGVPHAGRAERLHGDARPRDHDDPDHLVDLPRAVYRRSERS